MPKRAKAFYAYPSEPPALAETIEEAAQIVGRSKQLRLRTWRKALRPGSLVLSEVTRAIDDADLFLCDLTQINFNVVFELGYAVGRLRKVWISLNPTYKTSAQYRQLHPALVPILYAPYQNHHELASAIINNQPWKDLDDHLLGRGFKPRSPIASEPMLFYLQCPSPSTASLAVSQLAERLFPDPYRVDDNPQDNPSATVTWYAEKLQQCDIVIAHLLSDNQTDLLHHNVKCSFVCGMAHAFGRKVLMIAEEPYRCPLDYRPLLLTYDTAASCDSRVSNWLHNAIASLPPRRKRAAPVFEQQRRHLSLNSLYIGDPAAENEQLYLPAYFVPTDVFSYGLNAQKAIFVGRRGTGKTATFFALAHELSGDKRNHVCTIKPLGYDVDGLIRILRDNLHRVEQGYLIESMWKFLLLGELARSVKARFDLRPSHQVPTPDEELFLRFYNDHSDLMQPTFSERISRVVDSLQGLGKAVAFPTQMDRISEILHQTILAQLRDLLGRVLHDYNKVVILIDDLDSAWYPGQDADQFASIILGLLRVCDDLAVDFSKSSAWRRHVDFAILTFLRSDIFYHVQRLAREQNKLPIRRIVWDSEEALLRVIDERLENAFEGRFSAGEIFERLFTEKAGGMPIREYVTAMTIPRPRDIIFLISAAIASAVKRGHEMVTEDDFVSAREAYSEHAFRTVVGDDDPRYGKLEAVLFEFAGAPPIMARSEVIRRIRAAGIDEEVSWFYFDLLCDVHFLGIESRDGFKYARDEGERRMLREVAQGIAQRVEAREELYEINVAFHQVLQIR